jgi:hypothetical protein
MVPTRPASASAGEKRADAQTTRRIARSPFTYQVAMEDARRAPVHGFPYAECHRVLRDERLVIACLAHRHDRTLATKRALQRLDS